MDKGNRKIMYKIEKKLIEALLQYLASRPYAEVFQFVGLLQQLEEIKEEVKKDK